MYKYYKNFHLNEIMEKVSYSYTCQHLSSILDQINNNSETFCVKRQNGKQVIILDKDDYDSLIETAHLLKSPENARQLFKAMEEAEKGTGVKIEL